MDDLARGVAQLDAGQQRILESMSDPVDRTVPKHLRAGAARKEHPGDCYRKALEYVLRHPDDDEMWLVHGSVVAPQDERYGHAWVEIGEDYVYDGAKGHFYRRGDYVSVSQAIETDRYTAREAASFWFATRHCGPWHSHERSASTAAAPSPPR